MHDRLSLIHAVLRESFISAKKSILKLLQLLRMWWDLPCVIHIYTKFPNFAGLCFKLRMLSLVVMKDFVYIAWIKIYSIVGIVYFYNPFVYFSLIKTTTPKTVI